MSRKPMKNKRFYSTLELDIAFIYKNKIKVNPKEARRIRRRHPFGYQKMHIDYIYYKIIYKSTNFCRLL